MAFRTQKISQMTPKGANLEATDLIEVSTIESGSYVTRSITGQEIIDAAVGNVDWGDIGGTLSAQTDLQSALDAKVPTTRTLTINGVTQDLSADRTYTISTGITIGSTAITSGSVGRILFEGAGNVVQESSSLFWDNTNERLGIGTSSPARALDIVKTIASGAIEGIKIEVNHSSSTSAGILDFVHTQFDARFRIQSIAGAGGANPTLSFIVRSTTAMSILQSGNVNIGNTTTDAGFKLDVNGTARVQGNTTIVASGATLNINPTADTQITALYLNNTAGALRTSLYQNLSSGESRLWAGSGQFLTIWSQNAERIRIINGNTLINTTTDAGFRLDVNGTARVSSNLTVSGTLVANLLRAANLNESMILYQRRTATSGDGFSLFDNNVVNGSNVNINILNIGGSYGTLGTCVHNNLLISREINLASGTQTVRGIYYNPTLTNTTGLTTHYAIHTAVGRIRFENLPTSPAGLSSGDLWNNLGVLMIV